MSVPIFYINPHQILPKILNILRPVTKWRAIFFPKTATQTSDRCIFFLEPRITEDAMSSIVTAIFLEKEFQCCIFQYATFGNAFHPWFISPSGCRLPSQFLRGRPQTMENRDWQGPLSYNQTFFFEKFRPWTFLDHYVSIVKGWDFVTWCQKLPEVSKMLEGAPVRAKVPNGRDRLGKHYFVLFVKFKLKLIYHSSLGKPRCP